MSSSSRASNQSTQGHQTIRKREKILLTKFITYSIRMQFFGEGFGGSTFNVKSIVGYDHNNGTLNDARVLGGFD